jgi:2'-5' RNA ligase
MSYSILTLKLQKKVNMNLKEHYDHLYINAIEEIKNNQYIIDHQIDSSTDNRFGITVVIRPSLAVKNKIQDFIDKLKKDNPNQYYYPNLDIHITVLSIISCYNGFDLKTVSIPEYVKVIQKSIDGIKDLEIHFEGITASNSAIMIQGFPSNDLLNQLRNNLRENFKNSNLQQSIDARYTIQTAHSTVMRFRDKIIAMESLLETLEEYRTFDFGKFKVERIELMYNDWYQRNHLTKQLHSFEFK